MPGPRRRHFIRRHAGLHRESSHLPYAALGSQRVRLFNKSKSGKDNNDRLKLVLRALGDAGYIVKRNSESANYIATGKMGYVHTFLAWIAEYNSLSLDIGASDQVGAEYQGGLNL